MEFADYYRRAERYTSAHIAQDPGRIIGVMQDHRD